MITIKKELTKKGVCLTASNTAWGDESENDNFQCQFGCEAAQELAVKHAVPKSLRRHW
ncbi:hypothetical protein [Paenibacillus pabuli]|uniref:hypothetical protein n=1 Tax=Paenibacillus pabuli TaxID=1472 RepID=UPI001FFF5CAB|nr:hypothetical protein [Paenibacillus pabuli]UPK41530.1 hypothetical protein KET34_19970 [Paenibacillus pabuli]